MKERIIKLVKELSESDLRLLLSFIREEELDFINQLVYTRQELIEECVVFFNNKDSNILRAVAKDLEQFDKRLKNSIIKHRRTSATVATATKIGEVKLTDNQKLVLRKIEQMSAKTEDGRVRIDFIEIKDKSKFFLGGVITTLVEKQVIAVEITDKKKFVKITTTN